MQDPTEAPGLSAAALAAFRTCGFVQLPGFFDAREMAEIAAWTDEVAARPERPDALMVYGEESASSGARLVQRIEDLARFHNGFDDLFARGRLAATAARLLDGPAVLFKDKINFKLPGGGGFAAHQDMQAGWQRYAPYFLTALVAIDAADAANGGLEIAVNWRGGGLVGRDWTPLDETETAALDFQPVATAPGDAVFFDCFVPHRSGPNLSARPRRVLYVTYNRLADGDQRARYYADKRRDFPPDVAREPGKTYVFRV